MLAVDRAVFHAELYSRKVEDDIGGKIILATVWCRVKVYATATCRLNLAHFSFGLITTFPGIHLPHCR